MAPRIQRTPHGFTLIELMVVLVIVAILTAVALPSFTESVRKGRRADAVALLTGVQQAQERFRANNASYATTLEQLVGTPSSTKHYQASIVSAGTSTYTLRATARSGSPQASDSACSQMSLQMSVGGNVVYSGAGGQASPCWVR